MSDPQTQVVAQAIEDLVHRLLVRPSAWGDDSFWTIHRARELDRHIQAAIDVVLEAGAAGRAAIETLIAQDDPARRAAGILLLLTASDEADHNRAAETIAASSPDALPLLFESVRAMPRVNVARHLLNTGRLNNDPTLCIFAAEVLFSLGEPSVTPDVLRGWLNDDNPAVKRMAWRIVSLQPVAR
jgi:hypothetical protein